MWYNTIRFSCALQADLESKYQVIFHNFLKDLDFVQQTYELQKANPPRARDAPLVAGCIMWARHLLRCIEQPMNRFPCHSILFYSILFYSILFYSILFYSILFYSILSYPILSYPILSYPILSYPIPFYSWFWVWTLSLGFLAQGEITVVFGPLHCLSCVSHMLKALHKH